MNNPLLKITIQPFNNQILIANKMMIKPYIKGRKTPALPKYLSSKIGIDYAWNEKNKLVEISTGRLVPSNKNKAGLPRFWQVNFQDIYNDRLKREAKENYMKKHEAFVLPYVEDREFIYDTNLAMHLHFYIIDKTKNTTKDNKLLDEDNMVPLWHKTIRDVMKGVIIPDDSQTYFRGSKNDIDYVETEAETRLEITIWKR